MNSFFFLFLCNSETYSRYIYLSCWKITKRNETKHKQKEKENENSNPNGIKRKLHINLFSFKNYTLTLKSFNFCIFFVFLSLCSKDHRSS